MGWSSEKSIMKNTPWKCLRGHVPPVYVGGGAARNCMLKENACVWLDSIIKSNFPEHLHWNTANIHFIIAFEESCQTKYNCDLTEETLNVSKFTFQWFHSVDIFEKVTIDVLNATLTWQNQLAMIVAPCIWKMRTWLKITFFELSLHFICANVWQRKVH